MRLLFTLTAGLLAWVYGGYPAFLQVLRRLRRSPAELAAPTQFPSVTVIVTAYNEENTISDKIENSLALEYPEDRLDVIVASDGSTDRTNELVAAHPSPRVRLLPFAERRGKALVCNDAVASATGTWLLFTDAETRLAPDALRQLARHFADPATGMVDGELVCVNDDASSIASDVGLYWRFESMLKAAESDLGSLSSTFGSCSALRRSLFEPLLATEDVDFRTPLDLVAAGYRVVHEPRAQVAEVTHSGLREQYQARVRMVTKNLPGTLRRCDRRIARRPLVMLGIASHKLLRWFTPHVLLANLAATICLARSRPRYRVALAAHAALAALTAIGGIGWWRGRSIPVASSVFSFMVANAGFFKGVANGARGVQMSLYQPSQELAVSAPVEVKAPPPVAVPRRSTWWVAAVPLIVVPAVAVAVSLMAPAEYRSEATLTFSGRNTGSLDGDVEQARRAVEQDRSLASRTLDVAGVGGLDPASLQAAVQPERQALGSLGVAVNRSQAVEAEHLCGEFAFQLARDQRARIGSPRCVASKVAPRVPQNGLIALALAIPFALGLAMVVDRPRKRA